jgi:hypothetical protein
MLKRRNQNYQARIDSFACWQLCLTRQLSYTAFFWKLFYTSEFSTSLALERQDIEITIIYYFGLRTVDVDSRWAVVLSLPI